MNEQIEKQAIEEMACDMCTVILNCNDPYKPIPSCHAYQHAKRAYAKGYRKQEWISVEDRLPEESCECLAVDRNGVIYLAPYSDRYRAFNSTDEDEGDEFKLDSITHWMPLPEPPKMKGGAE